jgi:hypothetical protein
MTLTDVPLDMNIIEQIIETKWIFMIRIREYQIVEECDE